MNGQRNNVSLEMLEYDPKAKVLDLGCGNGYFTLRMQERADANLMYGVDVHGPSFKEDFKCHRDFQGPSEILIEAPLKAVLTNPKIVKV